MTTSMKFDVRDINKANLVLPGGKPYPFQEAGIKFIARANGNALLADDMGLGKTVQAIGYAHINPDKRPVVVVCPASLKINWTREIERWTQDDSIEIIESIKPYSFADSNWYIVNYDILHAHLVQLIGKKPQIVIFDEAHYLKSPKARRTNAAKRLSKAVPHRILATGTPLLSKPIEAWQLLNIIDENRWNNYWAFAYRYCDAKKKTIRVRGGHTRTVWDMDGASNVAELHERLRPIMIRRRKTDVLRELPDKVRSVVAMPIKLADYWRMADEIREELIEAENDAAAAVLIEKLKQLVVSLKLNPTIEWVQNFIEQEKLILFFTHRAVGETLHHRFPGAAIITGDTPQDKRQEEVDRFQNNPDCRLFLGNIQAAGVGLTLTAASNVAFLELGWTPSEHTQAEDRAHRIGQKNAVSVYYLLGEHTIDEWIFKKLESKRVVVESIVDGEPSGEGFDLSRSEMIRGLAKLIREGKNAAPKT